MAPMNNALSPRRSFSIRVAVLALSAKAYGGDSYFRAILPALERYGAAAEFVILTTDDRYAAATASGRRVRFVRVKNLLLRTGLGRLFWEQTILPRLIKRLDVDVVYTANNVGIFRSPRPCVVAIQNMEPLVASTRGVPIALRWRQRILGWLTHMSIRRASRVVAVSEYVRNFLVSQGTPNGKIDVIYHGIDDLGDGPAEPLGDEEGSAGHVASASKFVRYSNLTTLVRAYGKMRDRGFGGSLHFAGGTWDRRYEREVRSLAVNLGLESHIVFLGYVPRERLQAILRGCEVFLFASTLEACPFTLLEAMQQGAPIVTTNVGPMREICGDAAIYVEPLDSKAFGEAAYAIVKDPILREELRAKAQARARLFRWEDSVKRLLITLKKAVERST